MVLWVQNNLCFKMAGASPALQLNGGSLMEEFFEASLFSKPFLSAVIVAAGSSSRMGKADKIFLPINGIPVITRSLLAYENCADVSEIVVVTKESSIDAIKKIADENGISKLKTVVCGGETYWSEVVEREPVFNDLIKYE